MSIGQCSKSNDGAIAGTNLGRDEKSALENQDAWGQDSVCQDGNGDYYVLHGAVDLQIKGDASNPDDLRRKVVGLKSQTDDLKGDIAGIRVQIEKDKKTLAELGKSQGFFSKLIHDPVSGFFVEAGTVALAFGLVTSLAEDVMNWSALNNQASRNLMLQKMKNHHLQALGGCAVPLAGQQAKFDAKRAAIGAGVVGGVVAANHLLRGDGGDKASQVPGVEPSQPLPDLSAMSEADLKKLYQKLLAEYEQLGRTKAELVNQKTSLENEIVKKGGKVPDETSLDKVMGNRTVRLMADAAAAFGIGSTLIRSRYQTYFKFHDKVEAGMRALDAQAKAQAINQIAAGQCQAEPAKATEPVKATVVSTKTSAHFSMVDDPLTSTGLVSFDRGGMIYAHWVTVGGETYGLNLDAPQLALGQYATLDDFVAARDSLALGMGAEPTADDIVRSASLKGPGKITVPSVARLSTENEAAAAALERASSAEGAHVNGVPAGGVGRAAPAPAPVWRGAPVRIAVP
jgi:hypothetical protein